MKLFAWNSPVGKGTYVATGKNGAMIPEEHMSDSILAKRNEALATHCNDLMEELRHATDFRLRCEAIAETIRRAEQDEERYLGMLRRPVTSLGNEAALAARISESRERKALAEARLMSLLQPQTQGSAA